MTDRATLESSVRVILAMIVGCVATRLSQEQQAVLVAALLPIVWGVVSVYWSKKSDNAIKEASK